MAIREHPDRSIGMLRLELHVSAVLEVHQHRVVVVVIVRVVGSCRTGSPMLLLLLRLAGLAFTAGALGPSRLNDDGPVHAI